MRYVLKGGPPIAYVTWLALGNQDWQPTYQDLRNPEKALLHQELIAQQGAVCCYCGRRVSIENSHIEHFRPQGKYAELELEFTNLYASCIREVTRELPLHCGHAKDQEFDEALCISPAEVGCEQRFAYQLDGHIAVVDWEDMAAGYMLQVLRLDQPFLRNRRREALAGALTDEFLLNASDAELLDVALAFRNLDSQGIAPEFGHVIARYIERLVV